MNMNTMTYKGYIGSVAYSEKDQVFFGKIEGINDLVTFESDDVNKIEEEFHKAVDDYLIFCEEIGKEPDKDYKGSFNVRVTPELHKQLVDVSFWNGESLNSSVEKAIRLYVESELLKRKP